MTVPEDAGKVLNAIRLGWSVAEVRGRNRPDAPPGAKAGLPGPASHALPLHIEQTPTELRIQAQEVLGAMAKDLDVDAATNQPSYSQAIERKAESLSQARENAGRPGGASIPAGTAAPGAAAGDPAAGGAVAGDPAAGGAVAGDPAALWDSLQELIFKFDEHIQDVLTTGPDTIASGYQLGRALAEPYWALDPRLGQDAQSPAAWWFLLGQERCDEMSRLVGRLAAYFHPYTAAAIAGSVQVWKHVATDPAWRQNADDGLYLQIRRWYELVVMVQDPTTLVQPYAPSQNFRMARRALRIFLPEITALAIAALALSGFAVALSQNAVSSFLNGLLKSALGFLAITGFTVAGLTGWLKNQAQAMVTRLRQDVYTDLIAVAITTCPPMPDEPDTPPQNSAKMTQMVRERSITPVTPN